MQAQLNSKAENPKKKPIIFSGIQPSGMLQLGNYIGALRNFKLLQDDYDCLYCIVDLHAITVRQEPAKLRKLCYELVALYLAVGLDPERSLIYCQSHVSGHTELAWILGCYTYMGELQRMTQFKDKTAKHAENINAGLLTYPVLMAADILLFKSNLVPIGADQKQHLELTRDIAIRFNNIYGNVLTVPEPFIPKVGARIMSLLEPTRKMSKSDPEDTYISMLDSPDAVRRKLKRAVTDSEASIRFDAESKPGVSNLMSIYCSLTGSTLRQIEDDFAGKGYGHLKSAVAEAVIETLAPIQSEYARFMSDKGALDQIINNGAARARSLADRTMATVRKKVGLAPM
ncbi:MAG: tryptophan--tRNA ligase [Oscillospiraceae bacterium]|jgi:tryptophanyl-tRNA synthetase|nr:tryptophan--tRNA ligase [Oscillospiraceae bacterium]